MNPVEPFRVERDCRRIVEKRTFALSFDLAHSHQVAVEKVQPDHIVAVPPDHVGIERKIFFIFQLAFAHRNVGQDVEAQETDVPLRLPLECEAAGGGGDHAPGASGRSARNQAGEIERAAFADHEVRKVGGLPLFAGKDADLSGRKQGGGQEQNGKKWSHASSSPDCVNAVFFSFFLHSGSGRK